MKKATGQALGKIILSGEYAVVFGYPGIAIPAPFVVTATWEQLLLTLTPACRQAGSPFPFAKATCPTSSFRRAAGRRGERETRHHDLTIRYSGIENEAYLHRILEEVQKYTGPLHGHLTITNTIPIGRGMGSSTALVIAICRCLLDHLPLPSKNLALSIENTVNPGHSGLDFEVIWNEKPILFQKDKPTKVLDIPINLLMGIYGSPVLIDTGKPHETTAEMIALVTELIGIPSPSGGGLGRGGRKGNRRPPPPNPLPKGGGILALQTIAHCTERLLASESPLTVFRDHHRAQVALGIVPEPVQALIADIEKAGGAAKVVGAGGRSSEGTKIPSEARSAEPREGGGMVLALHQKPEKLHTIAQQHNMLTLALTQTPSLPTIYAPKKLRS